ncbi:MAG: PhoPQ-activated protein PqaA family protein, partial [Pirellulaceae bacterium]
DDLVGPKYVLQVPNAGHGLDGGHERVLSTVAAFFRHAATKTPLPQLEWEHVSSDDGYQLTISSTTKPTSAHLWAAHSGTKDFRESKWQAQPANGDANSNTFVATLAKPDRGCVAYYGELRFEHQGLPYSLCTVIRCCEPAQAED